MNIIQIFFFYFISKNVRNTKISHQFLGETFNIFEIHLRKVNYLNYVHSKILKNIWCNKKLQGLHAGC